MIRIDCKSNSGTLLDFKWFTKQEIIDCIHKQWIDQMKTKHGEHRKFYLAYK